MAFLLKCPNEVLQIIAEHLIAGDGDYADLWRRRRAVTDLSSFVQVSRRFHTNFNNLLYDHHATLNNDDSALPDGVPCGIVGAQNWPFNPSAERTMTAATFAAYNGCLKMTQKVIGTIPDICHMQHVTIALQTGHIDIAKLLLRTKTVMADIIARNQETARHWNPNLGQQTLEQPDHPIFEAVVSGDLDIVQQVAPADINIYHSPFGGKDNHIRKSPLHLACEYGHVEMVRRFLASGGDPEGQYEASSPTPLGLAFKGSHADVVGELITRFPHLLETPFNFYQALEHGHDRFVQLFFEAGTGMLPIEPDGDFVPLHFAIAGDNVTMVKMLVQLGVAIDPSTLRKVGDWWTGSKTWTMNVLAQNATNKNSLEIAQFLLSHNAQVLQASDDSDNLNALESVLRSNNVALAKLYLPHASKELIVSSLGVCRSPEMMQLLLEHGADVFKRASVGHVGWLPLEIFIHKALFAENLDRGDICAAVEFLAKTSEKIHLHTLCSVHARITTREKIVEILLDHGASPNSLNFLEETPLHLAATSGSKGIVELLLRAGANPNAQDFRGQTPLHKAVMHSQSSIRHSTRRECDSSIVELLLECGANGHVVDNEGVPALHFGESLFHTEAFIDRLLDLGADPAHRDSRGTPILVRLARRGEYAMDLAQRVLEIAPETIHLRDEAGTTPLIAACAMPSFCMVNLLLKHGAAEEINCTNKNAYTALDYAINCNSRGHFSKFEPHAVIRLLKDHGAVENTGSTLVRIHELEIDDYDSHDDGGEYQSDDSDLP